MSPANSKDMTYSLQDKHCVLLCNDSRGTTFARNRTLVVYSYYESNASGTNLESTTSKETARQNLRFFIREGVLGRSAPQEHEAHFVFVVHGRKLGVELPQRSNVQRFDRDNRGYEFCGVAELLADLAQYGVMTFAFFIFLNSSIRGPYYPLFLPVFTWTRGLTHRLDAKTKLSGATVGCSSKPNYVHLQSFVLATDCIGLRVIASSVRCHATKRDTIFGSEFPISRSIIRAGFNLASTMRYWYGHDFRKPISTLAKCRALKLNDVMQPGHYMADGVDPNPMELMFVKTNRGEMNSTKIYDSTPEVDYTP